MERAGMDYAEIIDHLKALSVPDAAAGAARFGVTPQTQQYGISMPDLRKLAKQIGKNHALAERLWASGIHEGRLLATLIADPRQVTEAQMERWVNGFDAWDVCDQCCGNLFDKTQWAYQKTVEWSTRQETYVKRAGFSLMAYLAIHDKKAPDSRFMPFLPIIQREAGDSRNFVKKAVNWALRQIGKRNRALNRLAIETAEAIRQSDSSTARWVASDALRELTGEAVQRRLKD
jgi:3-methyladenine DNA glycosylase AlkD